MTAQPILQVTHLRKNFGKFTALSDVSLQVNPGEVVGFIGPNGAGKSTTIRTILGMLKADGGSVTVFGQDAWQDAVNIHERLAYVPGDVYLWPNFTGGQTIDLLLKMSGQQHTPRTDALIQAFDLDPAKKNSTYSKGNRQKVALIASLSSDVDFYIFDEPTSGLDPLNENIFQQEVARLKAAGKAILLSSHILSEVEKMGDTIAIIRQGKIIEAGSLTQMRHLTRTNVTVTTQGDLASLAKLTGVHNFHLIDHQTTRATFAVDSEALSLVLQAVAALTVTNLQIAPPALEDLFMRYYDQAADPEVTGDVQK
ncbi:ATP-binding cassette domain-containing protein [Lapidilactobacillus achengensis]|uniref:ATP-binding cassette domain-containing protein n=1 Tax=Lapidilactobacillus achengensis TaxID=2486000 RepID=A0ABW1UMY1_9LACO|nr:ABC transporter ATP-binding protein [Lapidilactobacillus achengensis]